MSDLLKRTLASHLVDIQATTQFAEVPVEQLERMADKVRAEPPKKCRIGAYNR